MSVASQVPPVPLTAPQALLTTASTQLVVLSSFRAAALGHPGSKLMKMILSDPQKDPCYLQRCGLPVTRNDEDHEHVVDAQVAKDVALRHGDVQTQDLQHVLDRHRAVLIQLKHTRTQSRRHHAVSTGFSSAVVLSQRVPLQGRVSSSCPLVVVPSGTRFLCSLAQFCSAPQSSRSKNSSLQLPLGQLEVLSCGNVFECEVIISKDT